MSNHPPTASDLRQMLTDLREHLTQQQTFGWGNHVARIDAALSAPDALAAVEEENAVLREQNIEINDGAVALEKRLSAVEAERDRLRAERDRYAERERAFANGLRVADAGQYRADWPGAVDRCIRERDALRAEVARLEAELARLRDVRRLETTECADCNLFARCTEPRRGVALPESCPLRERPTLVTLRKP